MAWRPLNKDMYNVRGRGRGRGGGGRGSDRASNSFHVEEIENLNDNVVGEEQNDNNHEDEAMPEVGQLVNGRRVLELIGDTFLSSDKVARVITKIFKARIDPAGSSWKDITRETKDYYFEEFREKKLGRVPTHRELFLQTHTEKGDGTSFVDAKSKAVHDHMLAIRQQREDNSEEIDDNEIYLEAASGKRSDRVYGLRAVGVELRENKKYGSTGSTSTGYTAKLENEVKELRQTVSNITQQLQEQRQQIDEQRQQINEQRQQTKDRVRKLVRETVSNMSQTSSSTDRSHPPQP